MSERVTHKLGKTASSSWAKVSCTHQSNPSSWLYRGKCTPVKDYYGFGSLKCCMSHLHVVVIIDNRPMWACCCMLNADSMYLNLSLSLESLDSEGSSIPEPQHHFRCVRGDLRGDQRWKISRCPVLYLYSRPRSVNPLAAEVWKSGYEITIGEVQVFSVNVPLCDLFDL